MIPGLRRECLCPACEAVDEDDGEDEAMVEDECEEGPDEGDDEGGCRRAECS